ncbi:MAG: TolC family protein [Bacteroidota bacterium]
MKKILIILLFPIQLVSGQTEILLDSCYSWARQNYPNLKQSELWQEISSLKQENYGTAYLPQITLNGQITYQSDVTEVPVSMPGITIPTVTKDRYNTYAELRQTIWDGGISKTNKTLEEAILKSSLSQLEVELYKLNEQVAQAFFTIMVVEKQKAVVEAQNKVLDERLKTVESAIKNGFTEKSSALVLQAEILNMEQNSVQLDAAKNAAIQMLSILTGQPIPIDSEFRFAENANYSNHNLNRPELQLFASQINQLDTQKGLLVKTRNPKLFGFGKVGYGKPGLNMLLDEFKGYYLFGVGVSWNAFDWKNTARQKQVIQLQQEIILTQEETFTQNIQLILIQQKEQIKKLETMLENDQQMVALRTDISKAAASKLENETITASDFIQEVQAETVAKLNYELHKIQLTEAKEKYNLIRGKSQ